MNSLEKEQLLNEFLTRWTVENIQLITLDEYISFGNSDSFFYWITMKTEEIGYVNVRPDFFGLFEKEQYPQKQIKQYLQDDKYSWDKFWGNTAKEAFNNIKLELVEQYFGQFFDKQSKNLLS